MLTRKQIFYLIFLLLAGLLVALKLFHIDFMVNYSALPYRSFCNVNEKFNCDAVAASEFSHFLGIPIAFIGSFSNLILLVFLLVGYRHKALCPVLRHIYLGVFSLYAVGCILLALLSFIFVPSLCFVCMIFWAISIVTFLYLAVISRDLFSDIGASFRDVLSALWKAKVVVLSFLLVFVIGNLFVRYYLAQIGCGKKSHETQQCEHFQPETGTPYLGRGNTRLDIVVYTDFQCPWCRRAHHAVVDLVEQLDHKVRFIRRDFPLDISCNRALSRPFHPLSCQAAYFAKCAGEQGKYWQFHDELYKNMEILSSDIILNIGRLLSLDMDRLQECAAGSLAKAKVSADIEEALRFNIEATPSFRIFGEIFAGIINDGQIKEYLDYYPELKASVVKRIFEKDMGGNLQIIDVRSAERFNKGHLDGALNIPLEQFVKSVGRLNFNVPTLIYDQDGKLAGKVFDRAVEIGLTDVRLLKGGWTELQSLN